jgi:hypothetical protein
MQIQLPNIINISKTINYIITQNDDVMVIGCKGSEPYLFHIIG